MFSYHFLDRIRLADEGLKAIANLVNIRELGLFQTRVRGHTLAPFVNLRVLDAGKTPFDDEGLRSLSSMNQLTRLWLADTQITDNGLQYLSKLQTLEDIDLHSTAITDAGLQHLRPLTRLRKLNLMSTGVTDAGLTNLEQMESLEQLSLYRTRVTNAGLEALKELKSLREVDVRYRERRRQGSTRCRRLCPIRGSSLSRRRPVLVRRRQRRARV